MLTIASSVRGDGEITATLMVPPSILLPLARDSSWRYGQLSRTSPATTWLLRPAVATASTWTPSRSPAAVLKT